MMPVNEYSEVPDSNATVGGIDIAEGCAPGNINNAIRKVMADIAEGVVHAYPQTLDPTKQAAARANIGADKTVNYTPQTLTAPQQAQARDNIGAVAIADLPEVPVEVPLGTIMHFAADTPPDGWLVCDGTAVTALYPDLRSFLIVAGSPYGTSGADPLLPDLRGEFVRGWDGGRGVDAGRVFGSAQGDELRLHGHPWYADTSNGQTGGPSGGLMSRIGNYALREPYTGTPSNPAGQQIGGFGGTETRPRNVALLPCIRAYASVVNVPGQADLDNILQQTQVQVDDALDRVVGDATAAAEAKVSWKRVGKVPVGTGAAVTLTGLDLTKETLFILSYIGCSSTSGQTLRIRASENGGSSWLTAAAPISASANWSANILRGALEMFPDPDNNITITGTNTAASAGGSQTFHAPAELSTGGVAILLPTCDTIEFSWSGGNFRVTGAGPTEGDCIIIYQRG